MSHISPEPEDTRSRILRAAQRRFRKQGYHRTGLAEILLDAGAPKGSLYHHFPGGKEAIGVAVIESITAGLLQLLGGSRARSTEGAITAAGAQMALAIARTRHELCTLFAAFASERATAPQLALAVDTAYQALIAAIAERLRADGWSKGAAKDKATVVLALLEGGALLSQAQQSLRPFELAVRQAAFLCRREP